MAFCLSVKTILQVFTGLALFAGLIVLLTVHDNAGAWSQTPALRYVPYVIFALAFALGAFFTQSRVSFIAILLWIVTLLTDHACFNSEDPARAGATVFFASLYLPWVCALFYRFDERGLFTKSGALRGLLILSALLVILLLPAIPDISRRIAAPGSRLLRPVGGAVGVPFVAVGAFVAGLPFLVLRKPHESPLMGLLLALTALYGLAGLSFAVADGPARTGLLLFMAAAGALLLWSVLESSWRNANIDELTDLPGRRRLKHHLNRLGKAYVLAMADIDHFKKINDRYGHDVGDQVLRYVAGSLKQNHAGVAYRFGGEEFVIVCDRGSVREIKQDLEELRETIAARRFLLRAPGRPRKKPEAPGPATRPRRKDVVKVTISIGMARPTKTRNTPQAVLEAADKQLYKAKRTGRNRVCG